MKINRYIDHTLLQPTATLAAIEQLCTEAREYKFAAVCVPPPFVKKCKELLLGSGVNVATAIGYPLGYSAVEAKLAEILLSIVDGADEVDVVINFMAIKNNDWLYVSNELNHIIQVVKSHNKIIKVTVESGLLTVDELIKCCHLYGAAAIDYMNTSTGYAQNGATVEVVEIMRKHLPEAVQIKASAGISNNDFAMQLITAGANRLGCSAGVGMVNNKK